MSSEVGGAVKRLLILGGSAEARALSEMVAGLDDLDAVLSLAGRTEQPLGQGVRTRTGGFGGIDGLTDWLRAQSIDMLIDATHPFATQMSRHAVAAASALDVPILHVERPEWTPRPGEEWVRVSDLHAAVEALPPGARAFAATGRGSVEGFAARADIHTCLRVIEPSDKPFPGSGQFVVARPPFSVEAEIEVLRSHRITHLVVKNSGGAAARTKLDAAARLGLPIVIIDRVPLPNGVLTVRDARAALEWVIKRLGSA